MRRRKRIFLIILVNALLWRWMLPNSAGAQDLLLYLPFEEGKGSFTQDLSGESRYGRILGAGWTDKGKEGNALIFKGLTDSVEISNFPSLPQEFTLQAWIKISGGNRERTIVNKPGSFSFTIWHAPGNRLTGRIDLEDGSYHLLHSKKLLRENVWYRVSMSYDGREMKVFVNGKLEGVKEVKGKIAPGSSKLYISYPSSWQVFQGVIDEVKIFKGVKQPLPLKGAEEKVQLINSGPSNPFVYYQDRPFFPIGLYGAIWWDKENLERLRKIGFNLIGPRGDFKGVEDWKRFLDSAKVCGLLAWVSPTYKLRSPQPSLRWATFLVPPQEEEKEKFLRNLVLALKDHPALFLWDVGDEIEITKIPLAGVKKGYKLIKSLDPKGIVWTNHSWMSGYEAISPYNEVADVVSYDVYPFYDVGAQWSLGEMSIVGRYVQMLGKSVNHKKPVWMVLQADHGHQRGRFPTLKELRFMSYQAIVYGATGLLYFGQDITYGWTEEFKRALQKVIGELEVLSPILTAPRYPEKIEIKLTPGDGWISGRAWHFKDSVYLVALNESEEPLEVEFVFPQGEVREVEVLHENKAVELKGKGFKDLFEGYKVCVYKIRFEGEKFYK